jgi:hypothetical protein
MSVRSKLLKAELLLSGLARFTETDLVRCDHQTTCLYAECVRVSATRAANGDLLSSGFSNVVSNGAYPIADEGQVSLTPDWCGIGLRLQDREHFRCRYTPHHCADCREAYLAPGVDNEHRRVRNAAPLSCIQQIPFANDVPFDVAQDGKRQGQLSAQTFGFLACIDGNCGYGCARCENLSVMIAIVRQLAVAKWSPPAAIEQQHHCPMRCQIRKAPLYSCRIRQAKIRCHFASTRDFRHRSSLALRLRLIRPD